MNDKINGICIDGKFYIADAPYAPLDCTGCDFKRENCCGTRSQYIAPCKAFENDNVILKFSQELTDKLNGK